VSFEVVPVRRREERTKGENEIQGGKGLSLERTYDLRSLPSDLHQPVSERGGEGSVS
jgi:hypothetical protein